MESQLQALTKLKTKMDQHRPFSQDIIDNLAEWFEVELTYSSNALEGNTLTRRETALVIEKGLTIGGKPLQDHIEAINHKDALSLMHKIAGSQNDLITLADILSLHALILKRIDDKNAGTIRTVPVRISGSPVILPNPLKVESLLKKFIEELHAGKGHPVQLAAMAHYTLVSIHPFTDGNGRTARLLMNALLIRNGYPPALILPKDRLSYIKSLEKAQTGGPIEDYLKVIYKSVTRSFNIYLKALSNEVPLKLENKGALLKIGILSDLAKETVSTIRYWTKIGILEYETTTPAGYQLYNKCMIERVQMIRKWQKERYTLEEILQKLRHLEKAE